MENGQTSEAQTCLVKEKDSLLKPFIHLLDSSNKIRSQLESEELDNLSSQQVFGKIWQTHTGVSIEEQATAFAEGDQYSVEDYIQSLRKTGGKPAGSLDNVRLIEGQAPMLFDLPEPPKTEVAKLFFEMADQILSHPDRAGDFAYIAGASLQTFLNFIHPKLDGNGRSSEDWMLWWQKQLVKKSKQAVGAVQPTMDFLGIKPQPKIKADSVRSWYHHGLRARYGGQEDVLATPPFLKEEFSKMYSEGRELMFERTLEMNNFRRAMFGFLSDKLHYDGDPKNFGQYIKDNADKVNDIFNQIFETAIGDVQSLNSFSEFGFKMDNLWYMFTKTGQYAYRQLSKEEVIKPEYL